MKRYELFLAFRYLKARRKQAFTSIVSAVSILGIAVGVAALVIALALLTGFQEDIQAKIIGANAHVMIWRMGNLPIEEYGLVVDRAMEAPGVVAAGAVVLDYGLIDNGYGEAYATFKGVDAAAGTTELLDRVVEGSADGLLERGQRPGVLVGRAMADKLLLQVGDPLRVMVWNRNILTPLGSGSVKSYELRVVGVFDAGMYEYDTGWALVDISTAQRLFGLGQAASFVEVRVEDVYETEQVMEGIRERLGTDFMLMDWKSMNKVFFAALALEKLAMFVTISLIVFVAALNIVATLVLMVMEKNRDIGILLSMGATRRGILYTFIFQGLFIGLAGTVVGLGSGIGLSILADRYQLIELSEQVYYLSHVPFIVRPFDFTVVALLAVAISFIATIYPAWRASRLDPVEALRYE